MKNLKKLEKIASILAKDKGYRPNLCLAYCMNGYLYATDAHILIVQSLWFYAEDESELKNLDGKVFNAEALKLLSKCKQATAKKDFIEVIYYDIPMNMPYREKGLKEPNFEGILKFGISESVDKIGINPNYLKLLSSAMFNSNYGVKCEFFGEHKAIKVTTINSTDHKQVGIIMPCMITG